MIKNPTFESVYREELQKLYDAERQILNALPDMSSAAFSADLKAAFAEHVQDTTEQIARLEHILGGMGETPGSEVSDSMRALLAEARVLFNDMAASSILDLALVAAAQKVEHFEIAGYTTARNLAAALGREHESKLLERTLQEERDTNAQLADIAESVLAGEDVDEAEGEEPKVA